MNRTKSSLDQANTDITAPPIRPGATKIETYSSDMAGSAYNAKSPRPSELSGLKEIQGETSTLPNSTVPSSGIADSESPPRTTRSLTINNQETTNRVSEALNAIFNLGGTDRPLIVNFGKIEIINGSEGRGSSTSNGTASVIETIVASPDTSDRKVKRSESQITQTTRMALGRLSNLFEWVAKFPRPKPFTVIRQVKDVNNSWQWLEVQLDTGGGAGNLIPYSEVKKLGLLESMTPPTTTIHALGGTQLKIEGLVEVVGRWDGTQGRPATFHVVDKENEDVTEIMLGADSISTFKLLQIRFGVTTTGHGVTEDRKVDKQGQANKDKKDDKVAQNKADKDKKKKAMNKKVNRSLPQPNPRDNGVPEVNGNPGVNGTSGSTR